MAGKKKKSPGNSPVDQGTSHDSKLAPGLPPMPGSDQPPPPSSLPHESSIKVSGGLSNETYYKIQSMTSEMRVFLEHDFESKWESVKCYDYYRILLHFNPATKSRPNHKKILLYNAFKEKVYPILKPYMLPPQPIPMQTESTARRDFNPLSRRVKKDQLATAILDSRPITVIPAGADIRGLLYLYREHVDKDLIIPGDSEFIRTPSVVHRDMVKDLVMEELRMTLQERAPHVYIHSVPMSHTVLVNLYIMFVLGEPVEPGMLSTHTSFLQTNNVHVIRS
ncbi:uncharacterized protein MELLADRAFT_93113 [Melampsora larici-populina 98AG31]|uniref:Uncharacterized protein n=1 Tax=Melampsora larici-populina (strain 98AG31 / pathotype 3-4-7) TaxID=747676 RepID=F4S3Z5_MELLP|nr:uncharacterized protein MELLADRAFT_93113 [Melampsora larici-populina 98AG31]EGG00617.1 hypothetical protein MELLADRAFT_93113 [Melampsora larici-populina 98AG31]